MLFNILLVIFIIDSTSWHVAEIWWNKQAETWSGNSDLLSTFPKVLCRWSGHAFIEGNNFLFPFFVKYSCCLCFEAFCFLLQQLYARLSELLGLHDHLLLLNVIVGKIATNLKCYTEVKAPFFCFSCIDYIFP